MSDERIPYIKRLEEGLVRITKASDGYVNAMVKLHTTNYDRPAAGKAADMAFAELKKEIETAKSLLGGKYA